MKKFLSMVLALALCQSLLPGPALAGGVDDEPAPEPRAAQADINMAYDGFVFAQGVPIVIRENGDITSIYDSGGTLLSGDTDVSGRAIYGGWFDSGNTHTSSTSIVMESGAVQAIFGGSYSDVLDGNTNITLNGGTAGWVYGGGNQSDVTGAARVTVNSGAKVWGQKAYDPNAPDRGTIFGGGYAGSVSDTEVIFNGGDAQWIYGGGDGGCVCGSTRVKFMGQPDDFMVVSGGGNGGSVGTAVVELHGKGYSLANQSIYVFGGGWDDHVDQVDIIIGKGCEPPAAPARFCAKNPDATASTVGAASFDVTIDPARPSMMNSSGLDGTGVTGTVSAYIHSDASMDQYIYTNLTEIDELILDGLYFRSSSDGITLDRLELRDSGSIAVPAKQGVTLKIGELAGSGRIYFEKLYNIEADITPITVDQITTAQGARIRVDRLGGLPDGKWEGAALFTGPGVGALGSLDCLTAVDDAYMLVKEGSTIKVAVNDGQKQAYLDPTPRFDREDKTYRYGETILVTMGLKCEGQPLAGQVVSVEGGISGVQTFATGVTGPDGLAAVSVPVNDAVWNSRNNALSGYFAGTEEYKDNRYAVCNGAGDFGYTIQPAQVTLSGGIPAPARGGVPVKALAVGGDAVCTAEVLWSPADAVFRPEVTYTASIRLVPKPGYGLDKGQIGTSVTFGGEVLALPARTEADGSLIIANVQTFAAFPAIHPTGVTLNKTSLSLNTGGSEQLTATVIPAGADNKAVTWSSSNTAVAVVDGSGIVTAVSAGSATITVATADGGKTASCAVTVRSGGGGGGGTTGTPSVTVPVSGDKSTVHVSASVSGSTATVSRIDAAQIDHVIGDDGQAGMVEIDFTGLGKPIQTVNLPAAAVGELAEKARKGEIRGLAVKLTDGEVSFDAGALSAIQSQAGSQITLTLAPAAPGRLNSSQKEAAGSSTVYDLTIRGGSGAISDLKGGYATVSLPYALAAGQHPSGVTVYYLDNAGNITPCTTRYDVGRESAVFTTGHFSLYFVGYDPAAVWVNPYSDVSEGAWYCDAVRFVSENGLMSGYGGGLFGPDDPLTRAQLVQILYNRAGRPAAGGACAFPDAPSGAWYTSAVTWAAGQKIAAGYGNGLFGPDDNITREQLAVMLWRYAGSPAADGELDFADAGKISGYAQEAIRWAVGHGVVQGKEDGALDPKGYATRAEAAAMLMRLWDT